MNGGVIVSTQEAIDQNRNVLDTAAIVHTDVNNHSTHDAKASTVGMGGVAAVTQGEDNTSVTQSGVSQGKLIVRDEQLQQSLTGQTTEEAAKSVNRTLTTDNLPGKLEQHWNVQEIEQEVTSKATALASVSKALAREAGDFAKAKEAEAKANGDAEGEKLWKEGGAAHVLLHTGLGLLTGNVAGAIGAAAASLAAPVLSEVQDGVTSVLKDAGLSDTVAKETGKIVASVTAAAGGAVIAGSQGAAAAFNVDTFNRQPHPTEERMIKENAERFAKQVYKTDNPTEAQTQAALSMLANTLQNMVDNNIGHTVPYFPEAENFLHQLQAEYAQVAPNLEIPNSGGQKLFYATADEKNKPYLNSETSEFAKNGIIVKTPIPPAVNENNAPSDRDRLTGLPLDDKGRYTQNIAVDGTTYAPKYFPCATPECLGNNLDMSDPGTQKYVQAMDKKVFDDISKASNVATIVNPAGAIGLVAGVLGPIGSVGSGVSSDEGGQAIAKEAIQATATRYFQNVYGLSVETANRLSTLIDMSGGWQAFINRLDGQLNQNTEKK